MIAFGRWLPQNTVHPPCEKPLRAIQKDGPLSTPESGRLWSRLSVSLPLWTSGEVHPLAPGWGAKG